MEEKILKNSRFVIKDAFDFGFKNYYSHVASTVSGILKSRGYLVKENSDLVREKEILCHARKEMVRARLQSQSTLSLNKP
jgi:hypothetical protein